MLHWSSMGCSMNYPVLLHYPWILHRPWTCLDHGMTLGFPAGHEWGPWEHWGCDQSTRRKEDKRWLNLAWKRINNWLNMSESSDKDLPILEVMSQYLHGYTNRLIFMHSASTDQTTWQFNAFILSWSPNTWHTRMISYFVNRKSDKHSSPSSNFKSTLACFQ